MLIHNAVIINEGEKFNGWIVIEKERILSVGKGLPPKTYKGKSLDANEKWLIPGVIDDQVHFRQPGLEHKEDLFSGSRAALAGGVTTFMEMPNTIPPTITQERLQEKFSLAKKHAVANYSFYFGASNDNIEEVKALSKGDCCGLKIFMGSSTGNLLVNSRPTLEALFAESPLLIATHCEDNELIQKQLEQANASYGESIPWREHGKIRSSEACYRSSSLAVELAEKHCARLHVLHLSTAKELSLFSDSPLREKRITAEVCAHHLWFCEEDYSRLGSKIKWNPAIKSRSDREALREALIKGQLDVVATDHAPHTREEKSKNYNSAPSGAPLIQHSLNMMLEMSLQGIFTLELVVEKMCHAPAILFNIKERGFIREGYFADIVLIDPSCEWEVSQENILYKCGWSPLEGARFHTRISHTWINGTLVVEEGTLLPPEMLPRGKKISFCQ